LEQAGLKKYDFDLFELIEAFVSLSLAVIRDLELVE
jgi:acetyl-CoA acetyltransferase